MKARIPLKRSIANASFVFFFLWCFKRKCWWFCKLRGHGITILTWCGHFLCRCNSGKADRQERFFIHMSLLLLSGEQNVTTQSRAVRSWTRELSPELWAKLSAPIDCMYITPRIEAYRACSTSQWWRTVADKPPWIKRAPTNTKKTFRTQWRLYASGQKE